jgi:hypothetical protein
LGVFEGLDGSAEIVTLGRGVGKFFGALDVGILVGFFVGPMVPTCKNAYARNSSLFFCEFGIESGMFSRKGLSLQVPALLEYHCFVSQNEESRNPS